MLQFLKKVGAGKKKFKDLSREEAYQAEKKIISGEATDIQIGAFWSAERIKYASVEELKGFIDLHREYMETVPVAVKTLDIAINYDGKDRSIHILPASIFIAAASGAYLSGHGAEDVPSKYGITYHQVLEKMGAKTPSKLETVAKTVEETGFGFAHQRLFAQKLFNLLPKRREFGLRTYHNTMERMLNPFNTDRVITGVSHPPYIQKYTELARHVGMNRITVFKSLEGGVEPFPNHETKVFFDGKEVIVHPDGVDKKLILRKFTVEENAQDCLGLLKGERKELEEFALLTAGILLVAAGVHKSLDEAKEASKESLLSGRAYEKFKQYAKITSEE
ncbi:anthranilate phosphoribosyltransferase [Persephonella sp.]